MLSTCNKFTLILSKIKIAQCNYKKILKLKMLPVGLILLNVLWKEGFIYGYSQTKQFYFLFLKYNSQGIGILSQMEFLLLAITKKQLNNYKLKDPHCNYLVFTSKGLKFYSQGALTIFAGGFILAKL